MVKLNGAKEHINSLKFEFDEFLKKGPYEFVVHYDKDRTQGNIIVRVKEEAPIFRWSVLIGDSIHNLRAALDYLVCQLIVSGQSQIGRESGFPIYRNLEGYNSSRSRNLKGICPRAEHIINRLKPYGSGGIESYWRLNQVDVYDKHRLLVAAIDTPRQIMFKPSSAWKKLIRPETLTLYRLPHPLVDGTKIMSFPIPPEARGENLDPDSLEATWDIRLLTPPEVEGRFISSVFAEFNCVVEKTVRILSRLI